MNKTTWAVVLALVLLLVLHPAAGLAAPPSLPPDVSAAPLFTSVSETRAGDEFEIKGKGCAPKARVDFSLYNPNQEFSGNDLAADDGSFSQFVHTPHGSQTGRLWVRAVCPAASGAEQWAQTTLLVTRPPLVITWTNVLFGLGTAFVSAGLGLAILRKPHHHNVRRRKRHKHKRRLA